jgi:hypothetical protein
VTKYLPEAQISHDDFTPSSDATSLDIDETDAAILGALEELPFSSVRRLAHATHLPKTMVYKQLSHKVWFATERLR